MKVAGWPARECGVRSVSPPNRGAPKCDGRDRQRSNSLASAPSLSRMPQSHAVARRARHSAPEDRFSRSPLLPFIAVARFRTLYQTCDSYSAGHDDPRDDPRASKQGKTAMVHSKLITVLLPSTLSRSLPVMIVDPKLSRLQEITCWHNLYGQQGFAVFIWVKRRLKNGQLSSQWYRLENDNSMAIVCVLLSV